MFEWGLCSGSYHLRNTEIFCVTLSVSNVPYVLV